MASLDSVPEEQFLIRVNHPSDYAQNSMMDMKVSC